LLVLGGLIFVSSALRAWAGSTVPVPWISPDEMIYALTGRSLYHSGTLSILGGPTPFYSLLVPAFAGLPLSAADLGFGYSLLKVLQAVAMSLAAVPVYLWGRSLVSARWALVAAALTLALPGLVYSGLVMSEVLFYPVVLLAAWAAARAIEEPTLARQAILVAVVAMAVLTRLQAIVLLPAFATAVGLDAVLARSTRTLRLLIPTLAVAAAVVVAWLGWRAGGGGGLGGYEVVAHDSYHLGAAARYVLYHAGSVALLTGVFPLCALLLLLVDAFRRGDADPPRRAFLAVAGAFTVWFVLEVGVFASRYVGQLAERDLIALAPLLFLALSLWIERGAPRGYWPMALVALAVAAPLVVLPLSRLATASAPQDAPTMAALWDLRYATSEGTLEIVFYVALGAAIVFFALVPRRLIAVVPAILGVALVGASVAASRYAAESATTLQAQSVGTDPRWIDRSARGSVAYLYEPDADWVEVWQNAFWNDRIDRVYTVDGASVLGPIPQQPIAILNNGVASANGKALAPAYVVAPFGYLDGAPPYSFAGETVASVDRPGSRTGRLALWKVDPPLRLRSRTTGLAPNGDVYANGDATLIAYGCAGRVFRVTLIAKEPQTVTVLRNGVPYKNLSFTSPTAWSATIPTAAPSEAAPRTCTLELRPTGLIGMTEFRVQNAT
jgi:4-amino-4-deoxy-L-arabinose transferase-like glycosyltransferase